MAHHISRREFAAIVATGAVAGRVAVPAALAQAPAGASVTAADIIARVRQNVGAEWKPDTVDTLKAGSESTRITGVATTAMATMAVLRQAVESGTNLIITFEPTFYSRSDATAPPAGRGGRGAAGAATTGAPTRLDPVFTAKNDFIARHNLVIFRLSDHWRARTPDPLTQGLATALGWKTPRSADTPDQFDVPPVDLGALAAAVKQALKLGGGIRVIGAPATRIQRVGLLPGTTPIQASVALLPNVDAIVAGEVREWESTEYVRDVIFSGRPKGLILVGRTSSEEPGMALAADWIRSFVSEVPVRHIAAGDAYWRPA